MTLLPVASRTLPEFLRPRSCPTTVPWSVPAFLLGEASVGRTMRGITSITFVRAAESVRRLGLARSSGEARSEPWHTFVVALMGERATGR